MNNLNSVLLEGNVVQLSEMTESGIFVFILESKRYYKVDGESACEVMRTHIRATGNVAEACHRRIKCDHKVRVIGRLDPNLHIMEPNINSIFAEHVEFKPLISKKETKE